MQIWRVNVNKETLIRESVPKNWEKLGGRGLLARILLDEVPPTCEPLGSKNKLIYAPGLLVGHRISSCDRISIGGKSPLTRGVKEANAGGRTGLYLTHLGIKALILEGKPSDGEKKLILLSMDGVQFKDASHVAGLGVYDTADRLHEEYGSKVAISLIGPGGEMMLTSAGIQNTDKDNVPSRIAARGGLGAVLGSKGIKAIVIDIAGGEAPEINDPNAFRAARKHYTKALNEHPQIQIYGEYGTPGMVKICHSFGGLPTRNFSSGDFEGADKISGETLRSMLLSRPGVSNPTHACMAGCTIRCSNIVGDEQGDMIVSPIEFENIGLLGSNLGIDDLDTIARINRELNDLGLDTIEVGAALGVAADAGYLKFGDGERVMALIDEIRQGTPLGRILGSGALATGKVLGVERIPVVKGQAMSAYDPRAIKGTGVTYATSPQGADHTCGLTIRAKIDHLDPKGQAALSRGGQINSAGYDTLGACMMGTFGFAVVPKTIPALLNARYGWDVSSDILQTLGKETLRLERLFNKRAGFTSADDRIPEWMTEEPLAPHKAVFDVSEDDLDGVFDLIDESRV